ncbi:MAG TPA: BTAD domain-containing putative transcriptional regulator [Acidimicrobiales bacterium]
MDEGELDANDFDAELADGRRKLAGGTPAAAAEVLTRALARWRGPAPGEVAGASWAVAEAARLEEQRLIALEALLEARLSLGHATDVVTQADLGEMVSTHARLQPDKVAARDFVHDRKSFDPEYLLKVFSTELIFSGARP